MNTSQHNATYDTPRNLADASKMLGAGRIIVAVDIGTHKVCCLIARLEEKAGILTPRIIGAGHTHAHGMKNATIIDIDAAAECIRKAVSAAEQIARVDIDEVNINITNAGGASHLVYFDIATAGHPIDEADLRRLLKALPAIQGQDGQSERLHTIPVSYTLDHTRGIRNPIGMYGNRLGINMHIISAAVPSLRNLETVISRAMLKTAQAISTPLASAEAVLLDDEKSLGVTMIDLGAGASTVAVCFDGEIVHTGTIPIGGQHITNDIAKGLSITTRNAERLKILYGSAIAMVSHDHEDIEVPLIGDSEVSEVNIICRSMLSSIIRPRVEEIFELLKKHLQTAGFAKIVGPRIVLTGGASQLAGISDCAQRYFNHDVRLARPKSPDGLDDSLAGPAFSTCIGMLLYICHPLTTKRIAHPRDEMLRAPLGKIGQWLRDNF